MSKAKSSRKEQPATPPVDNVDAAATPSKPRRSRLGLIIAVAVVIVAVPIFRNALHQTQLHEGYLSDLRAMAAASPSDAQVHAVLGARLAQTLDTTLEPEAAAELRKAIDLGARDPSVYFALAWAQASTGNLDDAKATLSEGQNTIHSSALGYALDGLRGLGPSPSPEAAMAAVSANAAQPVIDKYAQGSFLNAYVSYWGHTFPDKSGFSTRELWVAAEPNNPDVERLWGLGLLKNGRTPEAVGVLQKAVAMAPNSVDNRVALAQADDINGDTDGAKTQFLAALGDDSKSLPALLGFGHACLEEKLRYARPAFLRATKLYPQSVDAWIGLGRADIGNFYDLSEAETAFATAAKLAPNRTDYRGDYATVLIKNMKWDAAEKLIRDTISRDPNDPNAHYQLGHVLYSYNPTPDRIAEAERETRLAISMVGNAPLGYEQLGAILLRENKLSDAVDALNHAVSIHPDTVAPYSQLAQAYSRLGNRKLADLDNTRAAAMTVASQKIDTLLNDATERFTDVRYHEQLRDAYRAYDEPDNAAGEQNIIDRINKNPQAFQAGYTAYIQSIATVLGDPSIK